MTHEVFVGDLGPYHFIRLFFGYHSDPKLVKWRVVHTVALIILISTCMYLTKAQGLTNGICVEYMLYLVISLLLKDRHLRQFYQQIPAIDSLPHGKTIYTNLRKHQIIALWVWTVYRAVTTIIGISENFVAVEYWSKVKFDHILMVFIYLGIDVNQMTAVMIFYLLYMRVIIIRKTIQTNGFNKNPIMAFSSRKYIQMYELLLDSLYKNDLTLKIMTTIFLCTSTYRLQLLIFVVITLVKVAGVIFLPLVMVVGLTTPYVPFVCSVLLLDLVRDELTRIKMLTIQTYIKCKDERWRSDMRELRLVLETHPLQYSLWRIVSLSLYLVLSTLSFWIITGMGIVQISLH